MEMMMMMMMIIMCSSRKYPYPPPPPPHGRFFILTPHPFQRVYEDPPPLRNFRVFKTLLSQPLGSSKSI